MRSRIGLISSLCLCALALTSRSNGAAPAAEVWTAANLHDAAEKLTRAAETKGVEGTTLGGYGTQSAAVWRRARSGEAELHKTKTDLLVIEEGEATLVYGGAIPNSRITEPNEVRGTSIEGGVARKLGPGDVIRIPPNTPHQFILARGQTVSYFALKIAR